MKTDKTAMQFALEHADADRKRAMREGDAILHVMLTRHFSALMQMHAERLALEAEKGEQ